ncbi:unnamed protein product [Fusarium venenatum]|uniref:Uncharacterized protein n=1 Tax=Fusarium venenatum TaxID=56646 RepID=A0A2L2TSP2_9HYPO|nr:uncharacterized protein FVRRES_07381 [Fusarium venenatum]CEI62945.1 unnamed protein product [Fusarium venenatum]
MPTCGEDAGDIVAARGKPAIGNTKYVRRGNHSWAGITFGKVVYGVDKVLTSPCLEEFQYKFPDADLSKWEPSEDSPTQSLLSNATQTGRVSEEVKLKLQAKYPTTDVATKSKKRQQTQQKTGSTKRHKLTGSRTSSSIRISGYQEQRQGSAYNAETDRRQGGTTNGKLDKLSETMLKLVNVVSDPARKDDDVATINVQCMNRVIEDFKERIEGLEVEAQQRCDLRNSNVVIWLD